VQIERSNPDMEEKESARGRELAKLSLTVEPEALKNIISEGRLLEFANAVATQAAAQISAQIVDQVAQAAVAGGGSGGASASAAFIFDGGDFGTIPPRPKFVVVELDRLTRFAALQQFAAGAGGPG
jgi:hypothetical protein